MGRRVWVIRGGEENSLADDFVAGGYVAVGYPDIPDGRSVDRYDVTERLRLKGWTVPEARAEMFALFVHQVRAGDLVVLPDTSRRDVVLGRVDGDYEFLAHLSPDDHRHRRPVSWFGRHEVNLLPEACRDLSRQRQVLTERSSPVLLAHLESVERGELGRDAQETERPRAPRAPSAPRALRVRAAAPPRTPKATPPEGRRCSECFLVKAPDLFPDGGDVCVDCC